MPAKYEAAIESLEAALAAAHTDTASWGDDTDLKELRGIPDFERLLGDATATS